MRVTLMDWLISIQVYLSISNETLQLTLNITDRYTAISPTSLAKNNYQLIGLAALSVSIKFEEIAVPSLKLLCDLAENSYTTQQLVAMEKQIYFSLECYISNPQPIHFLRLLLHSPLQRPTRTLISQILSRVVYPTAVWSSSHACLYTSSCLSLFVQSAACRLESRSPPSVSCVGDGAARATGLRG